MSFSRGSSNAAYRCHYCSDSFCCDLFGSSVDQYLAGAGGATFNALPPGMRSLLGAPVRLMADQSVPPPPHQPPPPAAAAAGLLSRAAYRLAGFGAGLLDARGRAQLAALAGFGVVVGGTVRNVVTIRCRLAKCCDASIFALAAKFHLEPHDVVHSIITCIKDSFCFYFSKLV